MLVICNVFLFSTITHSQTTYFTEVADSVGMEHYFKHINFNGGGCAFFDSDNDGDDDIYLTSGNRRDQLLINTDGKFEEASFFSGLGLTDNFYTTGVVTGDLNNDGKEDIFVTTFGKGEILSKNILFINKGNNEYEDVWLQFNEVEKTAGAILLDFDNDGLLDIYCINYVDEVGFLRDTANVIIGYDHLCYQNTLYHNLGNLQFEDVTDSFINNGEENGCTLGALATDFDRDRDTDILVCNDFGNDIVANRLLANVNGAFLSHTEDYGFNDGIYSMGVASADLDHDLDMDYYVTNFGANITIENQIDSLVTSTDTIAGSTQNSEVGNELSISWGAAFIDYNNDSYEDLYVANAYVPAPPFLPSSFLDNDRFYENTGGFSFVEPQSNITGINNLNSGRGVAISDYDNDGDQDILVNVMRIPLNGEMLSQLYRNDLIVEDSNHWIQVKLEGLISNKSACGANVEMYSDDTHTLKELTCGSSHGSSNSKTLHFGVGEASTIDSLKIFWPNSHHTIDTYYNLVVDSIYQIQEDTTFLITETELDTTSVTSDGGITQILHPRKYLGNVIYRDNQERSVSDVKVYPNPVLRESSITIESKHKIVKVSMIDLTNRQIEIFHQPLENEFEKMFISHLETSNLNSGIYFLKVITDKYEAIHKLVIH